MHVLKEATTNLTDHAVLAEQLIQYANRYKASNEQVAQGISRALQLLKTVAIMMVHSMKFLRL